MAIIIIDKDGQQFVSPPQLDQFTYYRDNIFVRLYRELLTFNPDELLEGFTSVILSNVRILIGAIDYHNAINYIIRESYSNVDLWNNSTGSWIKTDLTNIIDGEPLKSNIDSSGNYHIIYVEGTTLKHSVNNGSPTTLGTTAAYAQQHLDFWIDEDDTLHVVANNGASLQYFYKTISGSWTADHPSDSFTGGVYVSICARGGKVWISYIRSGWSVRVIVKDGSWGSYTALNVADYYTDSYLFVDSSNHVTCIISQEGQQKIFIYKNTGGGWSLLETIDTSLLDYSLYQVKAAMNLDGDLYIGAFTANEDDDLYSFYIFTYDGVSIKTNFIESNTFDYRLIANRSIKSKALIAAYKKEGATNSVEIFIL